MNYIKKIIIYIKGHPLFSVAFLLAFIMITYGILKENPVAVESSTVKKGTYEQVVEEEGITRLKHKFTLTSPVDGVLRRVEKKAGEAITKGQILAIVDWDRPREIRSPVDGYILTVHRESSGHIPIGTPILDAGNIKELEIAAEILTQEASRLAPGNEVLIYGWGGEDLKGTIRLIEPSAFKKISALGVEEQRVRVVIDFPSESVDILLGDGFRMYLKIMAFRKENALIIPAAALFREDRDWFVYRILDGRARKTKIDMEYKSSTQASVHGLNEGDKVILFPGEAVKDGVRVE